MTRYDSLGEHMIDSLAVISELKFWLGDGTSNCALPPQSSNLIKGWRSIPFPLYFGENISSCNRGRRSSCKTEA